MNSTTQALEAMLAAFVPDSSPVSTEAQQRAAAMARSALSQRTDPWRQAVDEALIAHALDCTGPGDDPKEKVKELIEWAVTIATDPRVAEQAAEPVPKEVMAALDRMCMPLDESRLSGVTAQQDARCMATIRDYILATPAAREQEASATGAEPDGDKITEALENYRCANFQDEDGGLPLSDALAAAFGDKDIGRATQEIQLIADAVWEALATPTTTTTASEFPHRIVALLQEVAEGPFEDGNGECLMEDANKALAWLATTRKEPCIPKFGARDTQCSMGTPGCVVIHEATPTDADEAFEELYKVSSRDPSNREDLGFWRDGWAAGQRALGEKNV